MGADESTPIVPRGRIYTPPVLASRRLRLGASPEEDLEVLKMLDSQNHNRSGDTPVASLEFMQTIARLEREIEGLRAIVKDLEEVVGSSRDELVKAREELHEVLLLLKEQHKAQNEAREKQHLAQKEAREHAASERREARTKLFAFLERMLGPFVDDPWFRRGALAGLSVLALVLGGVGYVQLSRDGVTVGQKVQAAEIQRLKDQELEEDSSPRP